MNMNSECPICSNRIGFSKKPFLGKEITCNVCSTSLIVTGLDPIQLDESFEDIPLDIHPVETQGTVKLRCPLCGAKIAPSRKLKLRSRVVCPDCDEELEVTSIDPLQLAWVDSEFDDFLDEDEDLDFDLYGDDDDPY